MPGPGMEKQTETSRTLVIYAPIHQPALKAIQFGDQKSSICITVIYISNNSIKLRYLVK